MCKNKFRYLMADKNINSITQIINETGLSRDTINKLYHSKNVETLSLKILFIICDYFKCQLSDLLEYIPD